MLKNYILFFTLAEVSLKNLLKTAEFDIVV